MMPGSLSKLLEEERVSIWYSVPTALVQLSLRGDLASRDLSAMRWILFAGETFPGKHLRRLMEQLPGARLSHVYGSTEVNVCTYHHLPGADALSGPLPIGKACSTSATLVVDGEGRPVPEGETGELLVRGSTVMSGYWGEAERNREVLVRQPAAGGLDEVYFRTGDRVRALEDGTLTFVARADRQVKVRGYRVELEEVEAALLSLAPVEEAAVFTVPDGEGSQAIRAAVVVGSGEGSSSRGLRAELGAILPPQAVPTEVAILESFPRTPTNKVDRNALRKSVIGEDDDHGH
jgi:acyl-coenzyme A synthetase/AMP-(fatty) acid ligase